MKWVLLTLAGLTVLVAVVVIVGWMLPVAHEASRSATFARPPEQLYRILEEQYREQQVRSDVRTEVTESSPPRRMVARIADPSQPFGGTWTFELTPDGTGSRLTITERGEVYNPVYRFMSRFVFGHTASMDAFLRDLERAA